MHYAKYLLVLLGLGFANVGHAQFQAYACDYCTSAQFRDRARSLGLGKHYLYDLHTNDIRRYEVIRQVLPRMIRPPGGVEIIVVSVEVPDSVQATFDATHALWMLNDHHLGNVDATVPLDLSDPRLPMQLRDVTAFDMVNNSSHKRHLEDYMTVWLVNWPSQGSWGWFDQVTKAFFDLVHNFLSGGLAQGFFETDPISITFEVELPRGGSVVLTWSNEHHGDMHYEGGMERDENGNLIPRSIEDLAGDYSFFDDPAGLYRFGRYVEDQWGAPWPGYYCATVACVAVGPPEPQRLRSALNEMNGESGSESMRQAVQVTCYCAN